MLFKGIKKHEFYNIFFNDTVCLEYLSKLKWCSGFFCRKCSHSHYMKGKKNYSRRCKRCKYEESVTAHTLFHKLKFSIRSAFDLIFQISVPKKAVSTLALSEELEISYQSCLHFRRKVQKAMESSEQYPLEGYVEVDEFAVGGYDPESQGRAKGDKKLVQVALQITPSGDFGRAYALRIKDYSGKELRKIFDKHISNQTQVKTDKWRGYLPVKQVYPLLEQEYSENGSNFKELHLHIMNIKNWIRGIHHHISEKYIQRYLDEFHFRFNRRGFRENIFTKLIQKMINTPPVFVHKLLVRAT